MLGTSTFSRRDECGGVTCACTCPKRRNINVVIQDTCTLSSSVNKCITICTPSIHLVVRLANPLTYLVRDAGTVKDSKSRHNLLIRSQECVLLPSLLLFLSIIWLHRILRHSYGISFYFELAHEQSIRQSILRLIRYLIRHSICSIGRVYPYLTLYYKPLFIIALQRHPFLFLLYDKSLYKDKHKSDIPFLI